MEQIEGKYELIEMERSGAMKAETVEQYKVLEYVKDNFETGAVTLEILNSNSVLVTDSTGASIIVSYKDRKIEWE